MIQNSLEGGSIIQEWNCAIKHTGGITENRDGLRVILGELNVFLVLVLPIRGKSVLKSLHSTTTKTLINTINREEASILQYPVGLNRKVVTILMHASAPGMSMHITF